MAPEGQWQRRLGSFSRLGRCNSRRFLWQAHLIGLTQYLPLQMEGAPQTLDLFYRVAFHMSHHEDFRTVTV